MPSYQLDSVDGDKLILGNCKIEVAASVGATFYDLGAGMVTIYNHEPTMFDTQAGNAPDPVEGVASEEIKVDFELIEYDASLLNIIHGGLFSMSTTSSVQTIHAGGNADPTISSRAFRFTNTRTISGATVQNILTVYKATPDSGPQITLKSDNDTDPIAVMPYSITGKVDGSRTAGQQLYMLTYDVAP